MLDKEFLNLFIYIIKAKKRKHRGETKIEMSKFSAAFVKFVFF